MDEEKWKKVLKDIDFENEMTKNNIIEKFKKKFAIIHRYLRRLEK